jgi:hypothetical protein
VADDRIQRPNIPYSTPRYDEQNEAAFRREMMTLYAEVDAALLRLGQTLSESVVAHASNHETGGSDPITALAATVLTSGVLADARVQESNVTQHQAALSITESQISDLNHAVAALADIGDVTITGIASGEILKWNGSAWINQTLAEAGISEPGHTHATTDITSGTFADARIAQSNVTQHQAALSITESQISDLGSYLTQAAADALYSALGHTHLVADITDFDPTDYVAKVGDTMSGALDITLTGDIGLTIDTNTTPASFTASVLSGPYGLDGRRRLRDAGADRQHRHQLPDQRHGRGEGERHAGERGRAHACRS